MRTIPKRIQAIADYLNATVQVLKESKYGKTYVPCMVHTFKPTSFGRSVTYVLRTPTNQVITLVNRIGVRLPSRPWEVTTRGRTAYYWRLTDIRVYDF